MQRVHWGWPWRVDPRGSKGQAEGEVGPHAGASQTLAAPTGDLKSGRVQMEDNELELCVPASCSHWLQPPRRGLNLELIPRV